MKATFQRTVIVITPTEGSKEAWSSLKRACEGKGWKYNTVRKRTLPTYYKGALIERLVVLPSDAQ